MSTSAKTEPFDSAHVEKWLEVSRAYLTGPLDELCPGSAVEDQALRLAIARSLANHPPVILVDEPTAPLDSKRALTVVHILNNLARRYCTAIIVVTHDERIIPTFKRIDQICDGWAPEVASGGRPI